MEEEVDPVRDLSSGRDVPSFENRHETKTGVMALSQERHFVAKWTKEELEDHYFRTQDENIVLKKHARKQEDRIKRISTKLLRLMNDRKKQDNAGGGGCSSTKKRDIETEQIIEEQQDRIRELERQNKLLLEKLIVVKQQLDTQLKRPVPAGYRHVSSRVDTGLPRYSAKLISASDNTVGRVNQAAYSTYTVDRSEPASNAVDTIVAPLREQLDAYEQEISELQDQLREKHSKYEDDIHRIKSQLSRDHRQTLRENVSVIRLHRELKQKSSQLLALEVRCVEIEQNLKTSREEYEQLLSNADALGHQLQEEQQKSTLLQNKVVAMTTSNMIVAECKEKISDLEKENAILRDSNTKLIDNALDYEKFSEKFAAEKAQWQVETNRQERVANKSIPNDSSQEELIKEREIRQKLNGELDQLRTSFGQLEEQNEYLKKQRQLLTKINGTNLIEEGLAQAHSRHHVEEQLVCKSDENDNVELLKKTLTEVQADYAETISELEKTRNMLVVQHRINKDSQAEVEVLSRRLAKVQQDYEDRIMEQERLLELRAVQIQRLEYQVNDISPHEPPNMKLIHPEAGNIQNGANADTTIDGNQTSYHQTEKVENMTKKGVGLTINGHEASMQRRNEQPSSIPEEAANVTVADDVSPHDGTKDMAFPTPKPRNISKGALMLDEFEMSSLPARKPPIVPRETLKTISSDTLGGDKPSPSPRLTEISKMSSYSDSSSDDTDDDDDGVVVVSAPHIKTEKPTNSEESESGDDGPESDSDVVISPEISNISQYKAASTSVVILVSHLSFTSTAVLSNDNIRMLFVEYRFLNFPAEELETPFALPKSTATNQRIDFNFRKSFCLDWKENKKACQLFIDLVSSSSKEAKRITFTVVNEPPEDDEDNECEDIGFAHVDLGKIAADKKDIVDEVIEVFDANNPRIVIGHLGVTVQALSAMAALIFRKPDS